MNEFKNIIIGRIYCAYNEDSDDFIMIRVIDIYENDDKKFVKLAEIDQNNGFRINDDKIIDMEYKEFEEKIRSKWTYLRSSGLVSVSNIYAIKDDNIKDVCLIYFPNRKSGAPDPDNIFAVSRQSVNNIFAEFAGIEEVGMSVSTDTIPAGFTIADFLQNDGVISSKISHVYYTDTPDSLSKILDNKDTNEILTDLYNHALRFEMNTTEDYKEPENCIIRGYCKYLKDMISNTGFMDDIYSNMGIIRFDKPLKENEPLDHDDMLLVSVLCGGIRMNKAVPFKFNYDIDMSIVKMKYVLVMDTDDILWIVPYTVSKDEIAVEELYNIIDVETSKINDRLIKCVKAYDMSKGIESGTPDEMFH